ncbi:MAG: hypothetical protein QOG15_127 [Solirubrobacteraceae bacterium]|jgi:hypothetical protein|nr:hypothetical protein [Solirubrobacteraceae bacterium]
MNFLKKITDFANSEKAKELQEKAKKIANDPETREKIDNARKKVAEKIGGDKPSEKPASEPVPDPAPTAQAGTPQADPVPPPGGDTAA